MNKVLPNKELLILLQEEGDKNCASVIISVHFEENNWCLVSPRSLAKDTEEHLSSGKAT